METNQKLEIKETDLEITACRGGGPGGQHRNKVSTAIQLRYLPTNLLIRCETERSQSQNREIAMEILRAKLLSISRQTTQDKLDRLRQQQVGTGMRGDKRRTVRVQHGVVEDHLTGKSWRFDDYESGKWQ